ncbi:MAG: GHKL domain-containing protein [Planctomycetes bacterium]|nr:GHKL domain-containing protein [Planctomycetota bacterium]
MRDAAGRRVAASRSRLGRAPTILLTGLVVVLGAILVVHTEAERRRDLDQARALFREEAHARAARVREGFEHTFRSLYEGLRTIARLPGVRGLGAGAEALEFRGGGELFDANARRTIQELYNNLASNVAMSEVYVVPLDLDPEGERGDPSLPREPWVTFDELIVGRSASSSEAHEEHEELPEIEAYEYRVMVRQLDWFREHVPTEEHVDGLAYPALASREVITCDNRDYDPAHPDDADRSGLVYSVPFFDTDGSLAGCVSGVVLSPALRRLLPSGDFVLVDARRGQAVTPAGAGLWREHADAWSAGAAAEGLVYSESQRVAVRDELGGWRLWSGVPDDVFDARSDVAVARISARNAHVLTFLLALTAIGGAWYVRRRQRELHERNAELERRVRERTDELLDATRRAGMAEVASRMLHNVGNALNSASVSVRLLREANAATKAPVLARASAVLAEHVDDLPGFFARDPRARQLPALLAGLAAEWKNEHDRCNAEVDDLLRSTQHMAEILERQRDLAASAPCLLETLPVSDLAESALRVVQGSARASNVALEREYACETSVRVDRSRAGQILVNLLTNAIQACVGLADGRRHRIVVRTRVEAGAVLVEVEDDGPGIARENLERIFSGHFTTKANGHGIGLHASAVAAGEFGARLSVTSPGPGRGATFTLRLSDAEAPSLARAVPTAEPSPTAARVG